MFLYFIIVIWFWKNLLETFEIFGVVLQGLQQLITILLWLHVNFAFVSFLHSRVGENLVDGGPFIGIYFQERWNGIGQFVRVAEGNSFENTCAYFSVEPLKVCGSEWRSECAHFIQNTAEGPDVTLDSVRLVFPDLRTGVVRSTSLSTGQIFFEYFGNV